MSPLATRRMRLQALLDSATPGPWFVRPAPLDDWGLIRCATGELVARALSGKVDRPISHDVHRAIGTDPYDENAQLIAGAITELQSLLDSEARLEDLLQKARDRLDWDNGAEALCAEIDAVFGEAP